MRKVLTVALTVALATSLATPLTLLAQSAFGMATSVGTVAGRSVDPMGRGVFGERVELVRGTQVVSTTTTNGLGEWSFRSVEPGEYILRMNVRGRIAGLRVTVAAGQAINGTMIVVPAATASLQLGLVANLASLVPAMSATVAAAAASVVQDVETTELDDEILEAILEALPVAERQAFAASVVAAINAQPNGSAAPFQQYETLLLQIVVNPSVVPNFPPPQPVS